LKFPKNNKEIILTKQGDYVLQDANVYHSFEALEESIILTFQWPSLQNDQTPLN